MKTYARIDANIVAEVFRPAFYEEDVFTLGVPAVPPSDDNLEGMPERPPVLLFRKGDSIPIEARFTSAFVAGSRTEREFSGGIVYIVSGLKTAIETGAPMVAA